MEDKLEAKGVRFKILSNNLVTQLTITISFKIYNITLDPDLDPDPNWTKIQDPNSIYIWFQNTENKQPIKKGRHLRIVFEKDEIWTENILYVVFLQKTHSSAVHVRQRAESLLQTNHFDPAGIKEIADSVTNRCDIYVC